MPLAAGGLDGHLVGCAGGGGVCADEEEQEKVKLVCQKLKETSQLLYGHPSQHHAQFKNPLADQIKMSKFVKILKLMNLEMITTTSR